MQETRKLSTILFGDIAGYTSLMASDEKYALGLLNQFKSELEQIVPGHGGEIIQYFGDACLLSFDSTTQGVQCAIELQKNFRRNDIPIRIGMHLGEVVFKNNNAFGDGVNIASRIESMSVPGAIVVSKAIRDQIQNKTEFTLSSLGLFDFKNVPEPMNIYAVANEGLVVPGPEDLKGKGKPTVSKRSKWQAFVLPVVLVAALILTGSYFFSKDGTLTASENEAGFESTIAVFPFDVNASPDISYLGEGIVDLISTQLDEIPKLNSIDPNRIFSKLDNNTIISRNPEEAAKLSTDYGAVKFILGSIVQVGKEIQIAATKYDAQGNEIIRNSVKTNTDEGIAAAIDELIKELVADELQAAGFELGNLGALTSNNLESLKLYLQGEQAYRAVEYGKARRLFSQAIELDTTFALAWMRLHDAEGWIGWNNDLYSLNKWGEYKHTMPYKWQLYHEAKTYQRRADLRAISAYKNLIQRYGDTPAFHYGLAEFYFHLNEAYGRSPTEAKPHLLKTIELDPGNQESLQHLGDIAIMENDLEGMQLALSLRSENNGALEMRELILNDTVADAEIEHVLSLTSQTFFFPGLYFASEEKSFHNKLIDRFIQFRPTTVGKQFADVSKYGTTGREKEGYAAWKEFANIGINFGEFNLDMLQRCLPANLMADEEFLPFAEHYDELYHDTKDGNSPYEIYAAIKYSIALDKDQEVDDLKNKLQSLAVSPQTSNMVKHFEYSIRAFEAKTGGENEKALVFIDSSYLYPIGFWETQAVGYDKSIMAANIYAEQGNLEDAINYFNHSYVVTLGGELLYGYRNYKLSQWYEAIGDINNAIIKCNILLESYKNCDEKYRPWLEEVKERKERLIAQMN